MGYAFTLPIFKYLGGANVASYVHYPTISTDMLDIVSSGRVAYNNQGFVARNRVLSEIKSVYYKVFAKLYSVVGRTSDVVLVNSSWTQNHINKLWKIPEITFKVYPPCDVNEFKSVPQPVDDSTKPGYRIVSVAQFRPEKNHALQIQALDKLKNIVSPETWRKIKLVLIGSVRNEDDEKRVDSLRKLCSELEVSDNVEFHLNVSFDELKKQLADGLIGIHSMWNEHFGIGKEKV
jgi:alpha-1,2-mannosyltransferase